MFKAILNSPTLMTWGAYLTKFGSALILLPIILTQFPPEEIAVWFFFLLLLSMSLVVDSGFGPSMIRTISYFYSGAKEIPVSHGKKDLDSDTGVGLVNFDGLMRSLDTFGMLYFLLSIISMLIIFFLGGLAAKNLIDSSAEPEQLWSAFYFIVFRSFFVIQSIKWSSFIQGVDQVAKVKFAEALSEGVKILLMVVALVSGAGIYELMFLEFLHSVLFTFYVKSSVLKWFLRNSHEYRSKPKFDKKLFDSVWPPTWRFGLMQYGGFLTNNGGALIVSQLSDASLVAAFLLTQKLMFFIRQVSQAPLYSNLPRIFQMFARQDKRAIRDFCAKGIFIGLLLQALGLLALIFIAPVAMPFVGIETQLAPALVISIMCVALMLELHHAFHAQIYMGSNHVPFLLPALISGGGILLGSWLVVYEYGLTGVVLVQLIVQLALNNWYPVYLNLRLLNWPFRKYLRDMIFSIEFNR